MIFSEDLLGAPRRRGAAFRSTVIFSEDLLARPARRVPAFHTTVIKTHRYSLLDELDGRKPEVRLTF